MFRKLLLTAFVFVSAHAAFSQVGIGVTTPDPSAVLDLTSTSKGFLVPRMSFVQRGLLPQPATALLIYQYDNVPGFYYNSGTPFLPNWVLLNAPAAGPATPPLNIVSASLTGDNLLTATTFTNVPGATISFTPTTTSTYITYTAAGFGYTGSNTMVEFQILVNGVAVGGTEEKVGVYASNPVSNTSSTVWSTSFSKKVTVNAAVSNTVVVQYRTTAISGTTGIGIYTTSQPSQHATLSAFVQ